MLFEISENGIKDIDRLQPKEKKKLKRTIENIRNAKGIYDISHTKKIQGADKEYRIQIGIDYRMLVDLEHDLLVIKAIRPRKNVYRRKK